MRGSKAKKIRRYSYNGRDPKAARVLQKFPNGQIVIVGPHRVYRSLKKAYNRTRVNG